MTAQLPTGQRRYLSAAAAKIDAQAKGFTSFAVIEQRQAFKPPEFACVSPVETFLERAMQATMAGIMLVEMVQG